MRKAIFDAIRAAAPKGVFADVGNIAALDALLDKLGVPREGETARRTINAAGLTILTESEGCELTAYKDPVGIWTIGYGSTGPHVTPGKTITKAEAEALLRSDLVRFEDYVAAECKPSTDNQFSALVSFAFNLGEGALKDSTLRRKHLAGDYAGAAAEFGKWNKARVGGVLKVLPGLTKRRAREAELYKTG